MIVFMSYSHRDEAMRDELEVHLATLKRQGFVELWHDRRIDAGTDLHGEISAQLERADIVLLLVSPHFLASDYCNDVELARALEREASGEVKVIPVILEPCDWQSTPFGRLRATPTDGTPVSKFANRNDGYLEVVNDLRKAIEATTGGKPATRPAQAPQTAAPGSTTTPRSSNLRVKTPLSDHDRDRFRDESFEYVANFFENSLQELKRRHPDMDTRFRRNSADHFTAAVYVGGQKRTSCSVRLGADLAGDITYAHGDTARSDGFNEALSVIHDGYAPALRALGLASFGNRDEHGLSQEGAAECLWEIFIRPMQS